MLTAKEIHESQPNHYESLQLQEWPPSGPAPSSIPDAKLYPFPRTPTSEPKRERKEG